MRKLGILLVPLLALLLIIGNIGCTEDENPSQVDEIVKDGILVRLTTDKTTYEPGENVLINVYMENQSSEAIEYKYIEHHIYLTVRLPEMNYWVMLDSDGQKYISENWWGSNAVLNAGESITLETFWDQKWLSEIDASLGYYIIGATFNGSVGSEGGLHFWDWDLLVSSSVEVTIWAGSYENGVDRGAWLHDEEGGVWYQGAQLTAEPKDGGDASRAKAKYQETLAEIAGLNKMGITRYPFPDGNWVISVGFRSQPELDDAMRQGIIPAFLDGVPVLVDDSCGANVLE